MNKVILMGRLTRDLDIRTATAENTMTIARYTLAAGMDRRKTTEFLSEALECWLSSHGKPWSKEVSIDYGTTNVKRIDFMQFEPKGVVYQSDIEKGIFTCYEVKSCREDVFSGNGLNFLGEKNYIVTTMACYKNIQPEMRSRKLDQHIIKCNSESSLHYGIIVPVPWGTKPEEEYENPTELNRNIKWEMRIIYPCVQGGRKRSTTELLFCMLRSGR